MREEQTVLRIVCFGDSNTYGFDPRDPIEKRYAPEDRWPEILAERTGWDVINMGLNGRTVPHGKRGIEQALAQISSRLPADCIIIMLGSNDLFTIDDPSAERIASRMDTFLSNLTDRFPSVPILLISPPQVEVPLAHIQEVIWDLTPKYRRLAAKYNILFASAASWRLPLSADEVHYSAEAHREFALNVEEHLIRFFRP